MYQVLLSLVRTKFVAVLLGTQGMGISGMLLSVTTLISSVTGLGISTSAVKHVAEADATGNPDRVAYVVAVVKKLALMTGLLAATITLLFSSQLSYVSFGSYAYTSFFLLLSVTFVLNSLAAGQSVLFQGLRKLKYLATSTVAGATVGVAVSIPLYYWFGTEGIVPALILTSVIGVGIAFAFGRRIRLPAVRVSFQESLQEGKEMVRLGIMIGLNGIIAAGTGYLLRVFISHEGGVADVGLYSAGFAIINTYVGMVFTAMGTDYYPRLSAVAREPEKANQLVNQQAEIALLILGPLLIFLFIVIKYAIALLYSAEFLGCVGMVQWAIFAILLKAVTWSVGFLFVAHGDGKLFFWNELIASAYTLLISLLCYLQFGLEGLGIGFLISYTLAVVQNVGLTSYKYSYSPSSNFVEVFFVHTLLSVSCFVLRFWIEDHLSNLVLVVLFLVSAIYSLLRLSKVLHLKEWFSRHLLRRHTD